MLDRVLADCSDFDEHSKPQPHSGTVPLGFSNSRAFSLYAGFGKRLLDILLVLASLPVLVPVLAVLAILVRRDGASAFFGQDRIGFNGEKFVCWKLRTMVPNAEELLETHLAQNPEARREWDEFQKLRNDPRITPIGRILRATSLDELPQFWCVLKGDMSLVGPRPFLPVQQQLYHGQSYYDLRPGITGLWQVTGHNDTSFVERVNFDESYSRKLTLWTDVKILFSTVKVVLRSDGV